MTERKALTCREACRLTGIGRTKLYDEIREGRLKARKLGSRTLILADDLAAWLQNLPPAHASLQAGERK